MKEKLSSLTLRKIDDALASECSRMTTKKKTPQPKTVINAFMFIMSVLKTQYTDLYMEVNGRVTLPENKPQVPVIIPPSDVFNAVKGSDIELPCLLAMWLSLSASEIRGLTKSKSIVNGQIVISETLVDTKNGPVRKAGGKEETRTRALDIPPYIKALIDKVDGDIIVPMSAQQIYLRLSKYLEANKLPHISFHRLRHINASVMALLNIPAKDANERGGWKTNYTRERVYTHTFTEQRREADAKIDTYFGNIVSPIADKIADN
jgi:integrase